MVHRESLQKEEIFKDEFKSYPLVGIKPCFAGYVVGDFLQVSLTSV